MTEATVIAQYDIAKPTHRLGDYHAWQFDFDQDAPGDMIWISKAHETAPLPHLVMPFGEPSIAVRRQRNARGEIHNIDLVICGAYSVGAWFRPKAGEELIALRMKPELFSIVFRHAPVEFQDRKPELAPPNITNICTLTLRIAETHSAYVVAQQLAHDLFAAAKQKTISHAPEHYAARFLRQTAGKNSISALANHLGVSERTLRRRFISTLGCSPKAYARRQRVSSTAMAADKCATPNWAQIAVDAGYHDQPHMIGEFKSLVGLTPKKIHIERQALSVISNTAHPTTC